MYQRILLPTDGSDLARDAAGLTPVRAAARSLQHMPRDSAGPPLTLHRLPPSVPIAVPGKGLPLDRAATISMWVAGARTGCGPALADFPRTLDAAITARSR
jgi:hypothetical protein